MVSRFEYLLVASRHAGVFGKPLTSSITVRKAGWWTRPLPERTMNNNTVEKPPPPQAQFKKWVKRFALVGFSLGLVGSLFTPDTQTTVGLWAVCSVPIAFLIICASRRCENCKAWWSVAEIDRERLGSYDTMKSVTRTKERRDAKGRLIHTDTWEEDIPITISIDEVTYKCRYCQRVHSEERKNESRKT